MKCPANRHDLLPDLKCCGLKRDIAWGKIIHATQVEVQHGSDIYVSNALINMYRKCGSTINAQGAFDSIQDPDLVSWNALLFAYVDNDKAHVVLDLFSRTKFAGLKPNSRTYIAAIKACTNSQNGGNFERGREIHSQIGGHMDHYLQSALIDMYSKCGSMNNAQAVFDSTHRPNVVVWNALLLGYVENGEGLVSLNLFHKLKACGCIPDSVTYIAALKACTSLAANGGDTGKDYCLQWGKEIHSEASCHLNHGVQNALINMYGKCGSLSESRLVFDSMKDPDLISWNVMLLGYAENGEAHAALDLFSRMKEVGCLPNSVTYIAVLKACSLIAMNGNVEDCIKLGRQIHLSISCHTDCNLQSTLLDMYANCGSMLDAHSIFDSMQKPDVVSWTALLSGYMKNGEALFALNLFSRMKAAGLMPTAVTYMAVLKACGMVGALALGRKIHSEIIEFGTYVVTSLVDFYAKCGSLKEAREVFEFHSRTRDLSTWNSLLAGYSRLGDTAMVFNIFEALQDEGLRPNAVTFVSILQCCSHAGLVAKARELFEVMSKQYGITATIIHYNCMVDILGRGNQLDEAVWVIRKMPCSPNAVIWTTLLAACRKWKNAEITGEALKALVSMDKSYAPTYVLTADVYRNSSI